jgi:hypothetical protein
MNLISTGSISLDSTFKSNAYPKKIDVTMYETDENGNSKPVLSPDSIQKDLHEELE